MKPVMFGVLLLLSSCASLRTEQQMAKVEIDVRAIQSDFSTLSATFTPAQQEKYAQAQVSHDEETFQQFYASLDAQQQATMVALLDRAAHVEQERQRIMETLQTDMGMRWWTRKHSGGLRGVYTSTFGVGGV